MTNEQLVDFTMELKENLASKQIELIIDNKEFPEKLNVTKAKFDDLMKKKIETLQSKIMIAGKNSTTLSINYKNSYDRIIEMKRNMHRLEQYLHRECNFKKYNKQPS